MSNRTPDLEPHQRIIVALDVSDPAVAHGAVVELSPYVGGFKVGYQLGYSIGWSQAAQLVTDLGGKVFLDPKLNDIPNTMGQGINALGSLGPWMINVHASAGPDGMQAASENKGAALLLAVTVLTSMSEDQSRHVFGAGSQEKVLQFALDAVNSGADGLVCSPQELKLLSQDSRLDTLLRVTPGVRPVWAGGDDQKRVMSPHEAVSLGADYLVIGRPIMKPPSTLGTRVQAALKIADEIATQV